LCKIIEINMDSESRSQDSDLENFGYDTSKQITTNGPSKKGVTFVEGEAIEDHAPPTLLRTIRADVAYTK
jgi:hypothetical protein